MNMYNVVTTTQDENGHSVQSFTIVTETSASAFLYALESVKSIPVTILVTPMLIDEPASATNLILN